MSEEIKKQEIKIEIDDQTANGTYSNSGSYNPFRN
jgi:hypothetical protein